MIKKPDLNKVYSEPLPNPDNNYCYAYNDDNTYNYDYDSYDDYDYDHDRRRRPLR